MWFTSEKVLWGGDFTRGHELDPSRQATLLCGTDNDGASRSTTLWPRATMSPEDDREGQAAVFGRAVAPTGIGLTQTLDITVYESENTSLRLYDTRGFEIHDAERTVRAVKHKIASLRAETDASRQIHIAWTCILEQSHRVERVHLQHLNMLREEHVPSVVVITQALGDQKMEATVRSLAVPHDVVVPVMAHDKPVGPHLIKAHGLETLIDATLTLLPEAQAQAFVAAQQVRWDLKRHAAARAINTASGAAASSAFAPIEGIPGGHSMALLVIQVGLMAQINCIVGVKLRDGAAKELAAGFIGVALARLGGQTAFAFAMTELMRFVPGGAIGAAWVGGPIGATITKLFGHLYFDVVTPYAQTGGSAPSAEELSKQMQQLLAHNQERYRMIAEDRDR